MTDAGYDLGPVPTRIAVDPDLVRRLIDEQFPQWRGLEIKPVRPGGWDNWTYRLGDSMSIRLPSEAPYVQAVQKEHRWLPVLAPQLPLPISTPIALGRPGQGYPFAWSVYRWLPGVPASRDTVGDQSELGAALAGFLGCLLRVDPSGGPGPGQHNWFRGGPLTTFAPQLRNALETLGDRVPKDLVEQIWQVALAATWDRRSVWFHGDVAEGNLLLDNGDLTAVIDFGTCGVGDPACDLAIAWTLLSEAGRERFRTDLGVDADTWHRGRGWALWKTLVTYGYAVEDNDSEVEQLRVLDEILSEYRSK